VCVCVCELMIIGPTSPS